MSSSCGADPAWADADLSDAVVNEAAVALLRVVMSLRQTVPLRAGLHVGPVVAAVLGTSRLAFDVFGDAVNVASRCMSTADGPNTVTLSLPFVHRLVTAAPLGLQTESLRRAVDTADTPLSLPDVELHPPRERDMRGRGFQLVREVADAGEAVGGPAGDVLGCLDVDARLS